MLPKDFSFEHGDSKLASCPGCHLTLCYAQQCHNIFFNTVHLLPKELRFEYGGAKLDSCPGRHLTLCYAQQCRKYFLQYSTFASERTQVRTWGRQTCFLPRVPSNLVLRTTMSQVFSSIQYICFRKNLGSNMGTTNLLLAPGAI